MLRFSRLVTNSPPALQPMVTHWFARHLLRVDALATIVVVGECVGIAFYACFIKGGYNMLLCVAEYHRIKIHSSDALEALEDVCGSDDGVSWSLSCSASWLLLSLVWGSTAAGAALVFLEEVLVGSSFRRMSSVRK